MFTTEIKSKAKLKHATIVLPEANIDGRVFSACKKIIKDKLCKIIVFGSPSDFPKSFYKKCEIIDIETDQRTDDFVKQLVELRKNKGMTTTEAKKLIKQPIYFSMMLVKNGYADGVVAGAKLTTADSLRPALQILKTKNGRNIVTGSVLLTKPKAKNLLLGDVSLIPNPTAEQLAEIAVSNAEFIEKIVGEDARVAMLSYSTKGSAQNEMIDKVATATKIAKKTLRGKVDGEMQGDAALVPTIAKNKKLIGKVGGNANVLIFPDLNAGNIGYKLSQHLGGYMVIGPIMLNFAKPVNDLSRGCTVEEIINTVCITILQK